MIQLDHTFRSIGRGIAERHPSAREPVLRGWYYYQLAYARAVCARDALRYAHHTDISPFDVVTVDPDRIEFLVERDGYPSQTRGRAEFPNSKFTYAGTVRGGDWDRRDTRFEDTDLYRAFEAHFDRGVPWSETAFFERVLAFLDDGIDLWGCSTRAEFERRCQRVDALYESIRDRGYRSNRELARTTTPDPVREEANPVAHPAHDEIAVCIGREGDLLFFDGRTRLAIAKVLDLDAVPVWIMVRHREWQELRESVAELAPSHPALTEGLAKHPDVRPVLGE